MIPDIAAIIAACEAVTHRLPKVIGKPEAEMAQAGLHRLGSKAETTAILGDQLDTDMTMAQQSGICGVLVMSGETTPEKLSKWPQDSRPELIAENAAEIVKWLRP